MRLSRGKSFLAEETPGQWTGSGSMPGWPRKNKETSMDVACSGVNNKGKVLADEVTEERVTRSY